MSNSLREPWLGRTATHQANKPQRWLEARSSQMELRATSSTAFACPRPARPAGLGLRRCTALLR
jgi:hypothetical protein